MTVCDTIDDTRSLILNLTFDEVSIELPATGRWEIPGGQRLHAIGPWPRRWRRSAFTTGGRLDVPFDPFAMRLELTLALGGDQRLPAVRCEATLAEADRLGRWTFAGIASAGGEPSSSITVRAWYQGVYDHGARPVALLRMATRLPSPARKPSGRRLRPRVDVLGDINACWLFSYPSYPVSSTTRRIRATDRTSRTG